MTSPTRPIFRVSGIATLKHLNIRKEGPDDEKILAVDVKLAFEKLDRVLCAYFDEALVPFLWRDDAMIVRNAFLQPIAYLNEISGATVQIESATFRGCEVKKFAISPRDGGVIDLVCSVALYEPTADEIGDLSRRLQDGARVEIEGPPDLFDGDANDKLKGRHDQA